MRAQNDNSNEVFNKIRSTLTQREEEVLNFIKQFPGFTASEIADKMNKKHNQISGRFKPLKEKGKIIKVGTKIIEGSPNAQWEAVVTKAIIQPKINHSTNQFLIF